MEREPVFDDTLDVVRTAMRIAEGRTFGIVNESRLPIGGVAVGYASYIRCGGELFSCPDTFSTDPHRIRKLLWSLGGRCIEPHVVIAVSFVQETSERHLLGDFSFKARLRPIGKNEIDDNRFDSDSLPDVSVFRLASEFSVSDPHMTRRRIVSDLGIAVREAFDEWNLCS
ncbi:MAG: hypothetical protein HGA33_06610 [Candidatus Moranbacteria bacterium]|nr:hypothetical protein [Candidatus Moranbacteria bacterium]